MARSSLCTYTFKMVDFILGLGMASSILLEGKDKCINLFN